MPRWVFIPGIVAERKGGRFSLTGSLGPRPLCAAVCGWVGQFRRKCVILRGCYLSMTGAGLSGIGVG